MLDCDLLLVDTVNGRMSGAGLDAALALDPEPSTVVAVVATAGTTNAGIIDDLAGIGEVARDRGLWFHVDGAYGGAALFAPSVRRRFDGIELADSLVVDPHKWLFAPFDCAALVYRSPMLAKGVHTQNAAYLDSIHDHDDEWNPTDFAYHLTRRARGLATWFSMAVHGLDAYSEAIERSLATARSVADRIRTMPHLELMAQPDLSVVMFRRRGWDLDRYHAWSDQLLADGIGLVLPSRWQGEPILRFAILHPETTLEIIDEILDTLA
jgi:glutamate/tyrosine decarboxylase-like PLP-dependent enzyme